MQHPARLSHQMRIPGALLGAVYLLGAHALLHAGPQEEQVGKRSTRSSGARQELRSVEAGSDEPRLQVLKEGSSGRSALKSARSVLPLNQLAPQDRAKAEDVLNEISLFRELPTLSVKVEPRVYSYFADHPEMAVAIWRAMRISKFELRRTGPGVYKSQTGDGTCGVIKVIHRARGNYLVLCEGVYNSPLLIKPIEAKALLHLQSRWARNENRTHYVTHRVRMYVSFPSQTVEAVAKLISPFSNWIIDRNFRDISLFVHMMSLAMSQRPGWVEHLSGRLQGVTEEQKTQLLDVTAHVYVKAHTPKTIPHASTADRTWDEALPPGQNADPGCKPSDSKATRRPLPATARTTVGEATRSSDSETTGSTRPVIASSPEPASQ